MVAHCWCSWEEQFYISQRNQSVKKCPKGWIKASKGLHPGHGLPFGDHCISPVYWLPFFPHHNAGNFFFFSHSIIHPDTWVNTPCSSTCFSGPVFLLVSSSFLLLTYLALFSSSSYNCRHYWVLLWSWVCIYMTFHFQLYLSNWSQWFLDMFSPDSSWCTYHDHFY